MSRNNIDQLIFKMMKAGEVLKTSRGHYLHPSKMTPDKNDKKIRNEAEDEAIRNGIRNDPLEMPAFLKR